MVKLSLPFVLLALGASSTTLASHSHRASSKTSGVSKAGTSCTFKTAADAIAGKAKCSTITLDNIEVPAGTTLDLTGLADNTKVIFNGKTTFGYKEWNDDSLISVSGNGITVTQTAGSSIQCDGQRWWDGEGSNGGKKKPKFFAAHKLTHSKIGPLTVYNTPVQAFSINGCTDLHVDSVTLDNSLGDSKGGHNTDAFDIGSSTGVYITNANVKNQDDCVAVNSGKDILFSKGTCSGGHGLSIGSVGGRSDNVVDGVRFEHSTVSNSDNGARIKSVSDATGTINNVTYTDITLSNIAKYGIVIQQDYKNGGPTGTPTNGVKITNINMNGVSGSVTSKGTDVYILCGKGSCSSWKWSGNNITGGKKSSACLNVPAPASC